MAYSFPLVHSNFLHLLPIRSMTMVLDDAMEVSETGGGEVLLADLGTGLWQGEITLGKMTPDEADEALAMIEAARGPGRSVLLYDVSRPGPRLDRNGAILGSRVVRLAAVSGNNRELRISGVPPAYGVRRGDMVGWTYAGRRAVHRVVNNTTAGSEGLSGLIEVVPPIQPGFTINTEVRLLKASCKAIIGPGTLQPGRREHTMTDGVSFKWRQTLST